MAGARPLLAAEHGSAYGVQMGHRWLRPAMWGWISTATAGCILAVIAVRTHQPNGFYDLGWSWDAMVELPFAIAVGAIVYVVLRAVKVAGASSGVGPTKEER